MKEKIPVIQYMFRKNFPVLSEVVKELPSEVHGVKSSHEALEILLGGTGGIVLFALHEKKDLVEIGTTLKSLKAGLKETPIKAVVVNFTDGHAIEEKALQLGVQDLISYQVSSKVLKFKIDFWIRAISVLTKRKEDFFSLPDLEIDLSERKDVQWLNSLNIENDIWLLENQVDIKKNGDSWIVKLMGPGNILGEWLPHHDRKWSFQLMGTEKELFMTGSGKWFFEGDEVPEFLNNENKWQFRGKDFELYYNEGRSHLSWMKSEDNELVIRKDSAFARAKEELIKDSFNHELIKSWGTEESGLQKLHSFFIQKDEVIPCRFDDYFDGDLILEVGDHRIQPSLEGEFFGEVKKGDKVRLKGRVSLVDNGFATVRLNETSGKLIEEIMDSFHQHQDLVDDLMKKIKGH